jgi:poly(U)-specific endoribonuclease
LIHYLEDTIKRLDKATPAADELSQKIEPSVCSSVRRLSAGAPKNQQEALRSALISHRVLPKYEANKTEFRAALVACKAVIGGTGNGETPKPQIGRLDPEPTEAELQTLNGVLGRLWQIDEERRLIPEKGYRLNHGGRAQWVEGNTRPSSGYEDSCSQPLFEYVDTKNLMSNSCTRAFIALLDNYELESDKAEVVTHEEKMEMDSFMHLLMATPHMRYAHKVLQKWVPDDVSADPLQFATQVFRIWFTNFGVGRGPDCSSGFEHVFVGEVDAKKGEMSGMHNWIQFWCQERKGKVNYKGYTGCITKEDTRLVSVRFGWAFKDKDVSTFLVGTSVAFEFAMYTIAFLGYGGHCEQQGIVLDNNVVGPIQVVTYPWSTSMGSVVRSAFIRHYAGGSREMTRD